MGGGWLLHSRVDVVGGGRRPDDGERVGRGVAQRERRGARVAAQALRRGVGRHGAVRRLGAHPHRVRGRRPQRHVRATPSRRHAECIVF